MKLNGRNIITDQDITVTGASNLGNNLSDILQNQDNDIKKLKGEVKWLYKYGGVGSGGGGGGDNAGGSSSSWAVYATLGGRTLVNGGTVSLPNGSATYNLSISVKNGNGNYSVKYTYADGSKSGRMTLNADNGWESSTTINIETNSVINVTVEDGSKTINIQTDYITNPYRFEDIKLVNNLGLEYQNLNKDIFISNAISGGLVASIDYNISIDATVTYYWEILGEKTEEETIENKSGKLEISFPEEYLDNDLAGMYEINCYIKVIVTNQEPDNITKNVVFNLIPESLYLKVAPEVGSIYNNVLDPETTNTHSYKIGSAIALTVRAYFGNNKNRPGSVTFSSYNVSGSGEIIEPCEDGNGEIPIVENQNSTIQTFYLTPGWKMIKLVCSMGGETYIVNKYLYLIETVTNYNWYKKGIEPSFSSYYRPNETAGNTINLSGIYYQMFSSSDNKEIKVQTPTADKVGDILISMGIQYNEINNTTLPIASFNYDDNGTAKPFCTLYQDKAIIENNEVGIFLEKTSSTIYNATEPSRYHLIQVLLKQTYYSESEGLDYKQVCIYIDGVLEGAVNTWLPYTRELGNVILYSGNYSINLLEVSNFSNYRTRTIEEVDINYYHNTYLIKSGALEEVEIENTDTKIIESLYEYSQNKEAKVAYAIKNNLLKLTGSAAITEISSSTKVPSLVCKADKTLLTYDPTGNTTIFDWINGTYEEQDSDQSVSVGLQGFRCPVSLRWYNKPDGNGNGVSFEEKKLITGDNLFGSNIEFYLRLQGSSTMRYKSKNFTLGVRNTSEEQDAPIPLFSPNFKKSDPTTFLPDNAFTLKADVVDSSHSNNTSLGKFINNAYKNAGIDGAKPSGDLRNHVKTCLEGFPILMFLEITDSLTGADTEYYYLGIYNFNLGRENHLNLGYMDLSALDSVEEPLTDKEYSFTSISIPSSQYQPVQNLIVAEVQGNNPMWDFSQYQSSVLFKVDSIAGDNNYMFGDIVYGSGENTTYKTKITDFVKSVSAAGNYIFTSLGKEFSNIVDIETGDTISSIAYRTINTVPDCDNQFKRRSDGKLFDLVERDGNFELNPTRTSASFNSDLLYSCVLAKTSGEDIIDPYLDYKSAVYYYTLCMIFGLVDSVQKNLNVKTWNGRTFGLYFYDMDTALGISNSGDNTSYFCFSDYWKTAITKLLDEDGNEILDEYGKPVYQNSGVNIYRDYYPEDSSLPIGYDIPSTYLFAVSKYAACFNKQLTGAEETVNLESPQNLWGQWRQKGGILETADKFVEEYFEGHLKDVPKVLLNLDYRIKYLYTTSGKEFNATDRNCLHGRQIERVKDWLSSRFHILDAYFNLGRETVLIYEKDKAAYYEPLCSVDTLNKNIDIQILHDIFSPINKDGTVTTLNRSGSLNFRVKARNYTPLIHKHANSLERFLLEDENTEYDITVHYNGNQTSKFGGSEGWTYLDSLNSFIQTLQNKGAFNLDTKRLEYVSGTKGELTGTMNINIPAARSLILTSPGYSSQLKIDNSFYNLIDVDISGSKISLTLEGSNVSSLKADNINSESLTLSSCSKLKKVSLSGATINKFTATPIWEEVRENLVLSGLKCKELTLQGTGGKLEIKDSSTLKSLTISGFSSVTVTGCSALETVVSNDSIDAILQTTTITGALGLKSISLVADNLTSLNLGGCTSLDYLELRKITAKGNIDLELPKLTSLSLNNTKIKRIVRPVRIGNSWVEDEERSNSNTLYITDYPNLTTLKLADNQEIEYIKFPNNETQGFSITNPFTNCKKLKRVYGHITINTESCFKGCNLFSIHGYNLDESGEVVLSGTNNSTSIKYNNISVVNKNDRVIHPLESAGMIEEVDGSGKYKMKFLDGDKCTNINFAFNNKSVLYSAFYNTSCTIFDIYYVFQNLYGTSSDLDISDCFYNQMGKTGKGFRFYWNDTTDNSPNRLMFKDWGYKIGTASQTLRNRAGKIRIFTTEFEDEEETLVVEGKEGLFYFMPNIKSLSLFLHGATIYTDRNIFVCSDLENGFKNLSNIYYFQPKDFIEGINNRTHTSIFKSNSSSYSDEFLINNFRDGGELVLGNMKGLFKYCKKLTSLRICFNTLNYINYNTAQFEIPNSVTQITYSFISSYAIGELRLSDMFVEGTNTALTAINQSFRVSNSIDSYISGLGSLAGSLVSDETKDAWMTIDNNTFSKFRSLSSIGYVSTDLDATEAVRSSDYSSFGGALKKILRDGEFPENIISHLDNLKTFTGFFRNVDSKKSDGSYNRLSIPGSLFKGKTKLSNISRCFQDFKGIIELTDKGFSDCPNLTDASYLFCITNPGDNCACLIDSNTNTKLGIQSMIPYQFFYHGENSSTTTKNIHGSNETAPINVATGEYDGWVLDVENLSATQIKEDVSINGEYSSKVVTTYSGLAGFEKDKEVIVNILVAPTTTRTIETYNEEGELTSRESIQFGNYSNSGIIVEETKIEDIPILHKSLNNIQSCFQGQGWITAYNNTNPVIELNEIYQPYTYLYNQKTKLWTIATDKCTSQYTYLWSFDGVNKVNGNEDNYYMLDEDIDTTTVGTIFAPPSTSYSETCTLNYFCPPDLLRYCTDDANISSLFYNSGYTEHFYLQTENENKLSTYVKFGLTGRICPYLLKPVPKVTSLYRFLTNSKRLSFYTLNARDIDGNIMDNVIGDTYLIPKTFFSYATNISNLEETFKGFNFPKKCKIDVFSPLTKPLNLNYTFQYPYFHATSSDKFEVSGLFIGKSILSAKGTFTVTLLQSSLPANAPYYWDQFVNFGVNFTKNNMPTETSSTDLKVQHVYDGYKSGFVSFGGLNETGNASTEFKVHSTQQTTPFNYRMSGVS